MKDPHLQKVSFGRTFTITKEVEHQAMMGLVVKEKWAVGQYLGMWGKLIKDSKVNEYQLRDLIDDANILKYYSPRGYVRNRLSDKDF